MCDTVGIKISSESPIAKCVSIIREIEPDLSISDIRTAIDNNEYVLSYDYTDEKGIKNIVKCYEELEKLGIKARLYELDNEECSIELIKNLDKMYDEISDDIDAEMEAEDNDDI
ncbi:MAG: hypothetical protein J6X33_07555 [Clostridiales bacterium]|nr:hypothetical protein [Clostridiales bacterium]